MPTNSSFNDFAWRTSSVTQDKQSGHLQQEVAIYAWSFIIQLNKSLYYKDMKIDQVATYHICLVSLISSRKHDVSCQTRCGRVYIASRDHLHN